MRYSTIAGQDILVGGFNPSEKYEFVSVGMMTFPIYGKKCPKPPYSTKIHV